MKYLKPILAAILTATLLVPATGSAADQKTKPKPYVLKTCPVSGDKLGEMGAPYVFVTDGREIKLCCKNCLKDFNKDKAKYLKQIEKDEKKAKKEAASDAKAGEK